MSIILSPSRPKADPTPPLPPRPSGILPLRAVRFVKARADGDRHGGITRSAWSGLVRSVQRRGHDEAPLQRRSRCRGSGPIFAMTYLTVAGSPRRRPPNRARGQSEDPGGGDLEKGQGGAASRVARRTNRENGTRSAQLTNRRKSARTRSLGDLTRLQCRRRQVEPTTRAVDPRQIHRSLRSD